MRTVDFDDLFNNAVRDAGKVVGTTLTVTQQERYANWIGERLKKIWTWTFWREITRYEERDTVAAADGAVYVPRAVNFDERIGDLYETGNVTGVSKNNPRTSSAPDWQLVSEDETGIFLPAGETASAVFVMWRRPTPRFTRVAYAAGTTYATGDLVYHSDTKNSYEAIMASTGKTPSSTSSYWRLQVIPERMASYVRMGVSADILRADRNWESFRIQHALAKDELLDLAAGEGGPQKLRILIEAPAQSASTAATQSVATEHVEAAATMDWTDTGATAVYTVPDGYDLAILGWILTTDSIDTPGTAPDLELGTATVSDEFWSGTSRSNADNAVHVIDRPQNLIPAGTVITATITSASTAATHAGKIVIRGHLLETT